MKRYQAYCRAAGIIERPFHLLPNLIKKAWLGAKGKSGKEVHDSYQAEARERDLAHGGHSDYDRLQKNVKAGWDAAAQAPQPTAPKEGN